ncbi:MAG: hypothetical protein H0W70_02530 [Actinobacteria bacterium]|nr:hypothetical protein [Actinomycetota bacterium]
MDDTPPLINPVFVDETDRRASAILIATRVIGALLFAYVVLLAGSIVRAPGINRVGLPGVGRLFPEANTLHPPSVDAAPNVTVVAADGRRDAIVRQRSGAPVIAGSSPATPASVGGTGVTRIDQGTRPSNGAANATPVKTTPGKGQPPATSPPNSSPSGTNTPAGRGPNGSGPPGHTAAAGGNGSGNGNGNAKGRGGTYGS